MAPPSTISNGDNHVSSGGIVPGRLMPEGVAARRAAAGKLNGGIAARTDSELFKAPAPWKPLAKRWDYRLSTESKARKSTVLKSLAKHMATPGMISLGGGLPLGEYFPFESFDVKVPALGKFTQAETEVSGEIMHIGKHDIRDGKSSYDLWVALNYGQATGSAQLLRWITEHTEIVHNPPYRDWACTMSAGSTSSLDMVYRMFLERGDYVISEEYTFATAVETSHPLGCRFVGVAMDEEGMIPSALDTLLATWDVEARGARKPFLMYTVPSGQNPTGATQSAQRRKEIYKVAQKHDLIIIEDEPYYFLQMNPYGVPAEEQKTQLTSEEFIASLVPSLLSIDTDGRVVRLDSFSKVLAPGSRTGWVVASAQICERIQRHGEVSTQHPSGISQVILHRLLDEQWGHAGYLQWLGNIRKEYTQRRDVLMAACEEHLPKSVVSWTPPAAGMFHWMNLDISKYPGNKTPKEIEEEVFAKAIKECVLVTPGSYFLADQETEMKKVFFRATFAAAEFGAMNEAIRRFGVAIREVFGIEN
ncbi:pyridoxal phosphate-dependent transferase [Pyronema omphalodes]|nr:pyridoxal phosphate-dependent transferase [Pyronema omphalodes]